MNYPSCSIFLHNGASVPSGLARARLRRRGVRLYADMYGRRIVSPCGAAWASRRSATKSNCRAAPCLRRAAWRRSCRRAASRRRRQLMAAAQWAVRSRDSMAQSRNGNCKSPRAKTLQIRNHTHHVRATRMRSCLLLCACCEKIDPLSSHPPPLVALANVTAADARLARAAGSAATTV